MPKSPPAAPIDPAEPAEPVLLGEPKSYKLTKGMDLAGMVFFGAPAPATAIGVNGALQPVDPIPPKHERH